MATPMAQTATDDARHRQIRKTKRTINSNSRLVPRLLNDRKPANHNQKDGSVRELRLSWSLDHHTPPPIQSSLSSRAGVGPRFYACRVFALQTRTHAAG